jgi:hypothetical protein
MVLMASVRIIRWQTEDWWLAYLEEYPNYWTQGATLEDFRELLRDLHKDLTSGQIPFLRKVESLDVD